MMFGNLRQKVAKVMNFGQIVILIFIMKNKRNSSLDQKRRC